MKLKHILTILAICLLCSACVTHPPKKNDPMTEAKEAYEAAEFERSAALLMPLAQQGNPEAQYSLGYQFYYGLGVKRDKTQGYFWMQQAAQHGYEPAREALRRLTKGSRTEIDQ